MAAPSTLYERQYKDTINLLVQQMDTRLRGAVLVDTDFKGEKKFYNQIASQSLTQLTTRYADTPLSEPSYSRRMVTPSFYADASLEDPLDALQAVVDPKSALMQSKKSAAMRTMDDIVITAFDADASTGQNGTGTETFDTTTYGVAVTYGSGSSNSGMTKAKLLRARSIMNQNEVEREDRFVVMEDLQIADLLNTTEVSSSDYNVVKALVEGTVSRWIGFDIIHSERLGTSSSHRKCFAWQRNGMQLAIQKEPDGRITERPDKNYAWQVYMCLSLGATRMENARVIRILAAES